jgi:hypothetical protein
MWRRVSVRWRIIQLVAGLVIAVPSVALAQGVGFSIRQGYGPISGYVQTPAGGQPGTSDLKRPTFEELGIDNTTYTDIGVRYRRDKYTPYIGLRFINLDSSGILEDDLVTQGHSFLSGEYFDHKTSFDIYSFGVKGDFAKLRPKAELAIMDFSYKFATSSATADRSYAKPTVRVGVEKTLRLDRFEIGLEASGSIPISGMPEIYTVGAGAKYWLTEHVGVGATVQYFYLDYEDDQELPNHLRLEMEPAVSFALVFGF